MTDSIILEEEIDPDYEPTEEEVLEYAKWLGMDMETDQEFLWIAREGLKAPLPDNWKPCRTTDTEEIYYFNFSTGDSTWDHPCDGFYRQFYDDAKKKKMNEQGNFGGKQNSKEERKRKAKEKREVLEIVGKQRNRAPDKEDMEQLRSLKLQSSRLKGKQPGGLSSNKLKSFGKGLDLKPLPKIGSSPIANSKPLGLEDLNHDRPFSGTSGRKNNDNVIDSFGSRNSLSISDRGRARDSFNTEEYDFSSQSKEDESVHNFDAETDLDAWGQNTKEKGETKSKDESVNKRELASENERHEARLERLRKQHIKDQESLKQDFEEELEQAQRRHNRKMDRLQEEHERQLQSDKKKYEKTRQESNKEVEDSIDEDREKLFRTFKKEKEEIINQNEDEKAELMRRLEAETKEMIEELEREKDSSVDDANRALESYETQKSLMDKESKRIQNDKRSIENAKKELEKESMRLEKERKKLQDETLETERQTKKTKLLQKELQTREDELDRERSRILGEAESERREIQTTKESLEKLRKQIEEDQKKVSEQIETIDAAKEKNMKISKTLERERNEFEEKKNRGLEQESKGENDKVSYLEKRLRETEEKLSDYLRNADLEESKEAERVKTLSEELKQARSLYDEKEGLHSQELKKLRDTLSKESNKKLVEQEKQYIDQIKSLQSKLDETSANKQGSSNSNEDVLQKNQEIQALKKESDDLTKKLEVLQNAKNEQQAKFQENKENLNKQLDEQKQINHQSEAKWSEQMKKLESEKKKMQEVHDSLKTLNEEQNEEIKSLKDEVKATKQSLVDKDKELEQEKDIKSLSTDSLLKKLKAAQNELKATEDEMVKQKAKEFSLQEKLKKMETDLDDKNTLANSLQSDLSKQEKLTLEKQKKLRSLESELHLAEDKVRDKNDKIRLLEEQISKNAVSMLALTTDNSTSKITISDLSRKLEVSQLKISDLEVKYKDKSTSNEEQTKNVNKELTDQIDQYVTKLTETEVKLSKEVEERNLMEKKLKEMADIANRLDREVLAHQETKRKLNDLELYKKDWEERVYTLKRDRDGTRKEFDVIKHSFDALKADYDEVKLETQKNLNRVSLLEQKLHSKENELEESESLNLRIREARVALENEMQAKTDINRNLTKDLELQRTEIFKLQEENSAMKTEINNLRGESDCSKGKMQNLQAKDQAQRNDLMELQNKLKEEIRIRSDLEQEYQLSKAKLQTLEANSHTEINNLKSKLEIERSNLDELNHKLRMQQHTNDDLLTKLDNDAEKMAKMKNEISELRKSESVSGNNLDTKPLNDSYGSWSKGGDAFEHHLNQSTIMQGQLLSKIELLQNENENLKQRANLVESESKLATSDVIALRNRLEDTRRDRDGLEADNSALRNKIKNLLTDLERIKTERQSFESKLRDSEENEKKNIEKIILLEQEISSTKQEQRQKLKELELERSERGISNDFLLDINSKLEEVNQESKKLRKKIDAVTVKDTKEQDRLQTIEFKLEELRLSMNQEDTTAIFSELSSDGKVIKTMPGERTQRTNVPESNHEPLEELGNESFQNTKDSYFASFSSHIHADCVAEIDQLQDAQARECLKRALHEEKMVSKAIEFMSQQKKSLSKQKKRIESERNQWKLLAKETTRSAVSDERNVSNVELLKQMKHTLDAQISQINKEVIHIRHLEKLVKQRGEAVKEMKAISTYLEKEKIETRRLEALKYLEEIQGSLESENAVDDKSTDPDIKSPTTVSFAQAWEDKHTKATSKSQPMNESNEKQYEQPHKDSRHFAKNSNNHMDETDDDDEYEDGYDGFYNPCYTMPYMNFNPMMSPFTPYPLPPAGMMCPSPYAGLPYYVYGENQSGRTQLIPTGRHRSPLRERSTVNEKVTSGFSRTSQGINQRVSEVALCSPSDMNKFDVETNPLSSESPIPSSVAPAVAPYENYNEYSREAKKAAHLHSTWLLNFRNELRSPVWSGDDHMRLTRKVHKSKSRSRTRTKGKVKSSRKQINWGRYKENATYPENRY